MGTRSPSVQTSSPSEGLIERTLPQTKSAGQCLVMMPSQLAFLPWEGKCYQFTRKIPLGCREARGSEQVSKSDNVGWTTKVSGNFQLVEQN